MILDQRRTARPYARMADAPHIILRLSTKNPIEIGDFVSAFTALGNEYERFVRDARPDLAPEASVYVREVRAGSIEAELIPWAMTGAVTMISYMDQAMILEDFVRRYGTRLSTFFKPGGRLPEASKSELGDLMGQVASIANDPDAVAAIEAVEFQDGIRKVKASIKFRTPEARIAQAQITDQRAELDTKRDAQHPRVLLHFARSSIQDAKLGKRSGELAIVDAISPRALPVVYASDLAEQRIRHEMKESEDNVFKKTFDVDLNVEMRDAKPLAYRIVAVHAVIDTPDG